MIIVFVCSINTRKRLVCGTHTNTMSWRCEASVTPGTEVHFPWSGCIQIRAATVHRCSSRKAKLVAKECNCWSLVGSVVAPVSKLNVCQTQWAISLYFLSLTVPHEWSHTGKRKHCVMAAAHADQNVQIMEACYPYHRKKKRLASIHSKLDNKPTILSSLHFKGQNLSFCINTYISLI